MNTPLDPAAKKAYEVGYALFRVAAILPSRNFAESLERGSLDLLTMTISSQYGEAMVVLRSLRYLVSFGRDTGNIHPENAELLVKQMDALGSLIHDSAVSEITAADLSDIFGGSESGNGESNSNEWSGMSGGDTAREDEPSGAESETQMDNSGNRPGNKKAPASSIQERQETILRIIRQSGNCRSRDLQAALPDMSERTLRYDLQRLMEEGKIERNGPGGPASWYSAK